MARTSKTITSPPPAGRAAPASTRKKGAPPAPAPARPARSKAAATVAPTRNVPPVKAAPPAPSRAALQARIAELEAENAELKAREREARQGAKAVAKSSSGAQGSDGKQFADLEARVARLEQQAPGQPRATGSSAPARRRKGIDPGDSVPPGVAAQEPEPMDAEAEAALDAIQKHIPGG